ncbi:MAG: hypothetical protein WC799_07560 [Desulfobacteraceae bacterium]|jgi:hypothetical protein
MKKIKIIIVLIISTYFVAFNSYSSESSLSEAETVAQTYMTALFHGNLKLSFSLMDQEILQEQQNSIKNAYESSIKDGSSEIFVKQFNNINDLAELLKLPPNEFFVILSEKDRERARPEHLELMKKTIVKVTDSAFMEDNKAKVSLEIINPKPDGNPFMQKGGLILALKNGKWFVVGNAK